MSTATTTRITTRRGLAADVVEFGTDGPPLVFLHGAGGHLAHEPMLETLGESFHVYAPVWPGYGPDNTETALEDMLDFTLHGWDVVDQLNLDRAPHLVGHSMGGMIAAEMAALNPGSLDRLVLVASAGLWLDEHPITDIFAMLPFELAEVLFHDPVAGEKLLTAGQDFSSDGALTEFMVGNARRLGTAGKILFPIPNRRLSKRLYRITNPTLVLWGDDDRLIPPAYAAAFAEAIANVRLERLAECGHMIPHEQPAVAATLIKDFLA